MSSSNLKKTQKNKNIFFQRTLPSNEQIIFAMLLTLSGGFFDSYTFVNCNGIFANAQTGNLIFIGLEIAQGEYHRALRYVPSIASFVLGVIFNKYITNKIKNIKISNYINISLLIQIFVLVLIYVIPNIYIFDIRPWGISFTCAMQFDSFRRVNSVPFASVFCTGNLRSMSEHLFRYFYNKENLSKINALTYIIIISVFLLGVIIGGVLSSILHQHAILVPIIILTLNLFLAVVHDIYLFENEV